MIRLDHESTRSLYLQLEEQISELITTGQITGGTRLPSERQLAEDLGVSRSTVQQSYTMLRERRMIVGQGRQGSIVPAEAARLRSGMDRLRGFTQEMAELGRTASTRVLEHRIVTDRSVASLFGLPSTARFLFLVRIRLGDDVPLSRETAWYSLDAAPFLEGADLEGSIYGQLAAEGLIPAHCDQTIEATPPTQSERDIFGFEEAVPCLLIKRRTYLRDGPMVEYVEGVFRGDTYIYRLRLDS
ncbi:MAG: GntR family transcriptional regulator [Sphingomonas sp.]|nr:MAG: GntR family transcriptional regulator [Sphingomonas sp.]